MLAINNVNHHNAIGRYNELYIRKAAFLINSCFIDLGFIHRIIRLYSYLIIIFRGNASAYLQFMDIKSQMRAVIKPLVDWML
jgi:hypothetical protein